MYTVVVFEKGAVDDIEVVRSADEAALRKELDSGLAVIQINPGYTIEFFER